MFLINKIKYSIGNIFKKKEIRVLAVVNHYYGEGNNFNGKSTKQSVDIRRNIVKKVIRELRKISNIDIKICGIKGKSLIDIDKDFSYLKDPSFLVYESIEWMFSQADKYDYFINIEDDVLLTRETFEEILNFDKRNRKNECLHPNRIENENGDCYCVDLKAMPGWENVSKKYKNYRIKVAKNPHSGLAVLSKKKLNYAKKIVDLKRRDKIIGHYMASAYANLHKPFKMFRTCDNLLLHKVIHLDKWEPKNK